MKFSYYRDDQKWWRWSLREGRTLIADSGRSYRTKQECKRAIQLTRRSHEAEVPAGFKDSNIAAEELLRQMIANDGMQA